ncbi:unnamed protein product [Vitrella brassicaformis CCMP3155]|uniref:Uncharacterized protein n=1 Tax=Vitrella brassicaformis (strain CCMP3155) TaxID=1169540 RepID=A0A0G4EMU6_VITBC|nr:unnamed protein product [Vitrella brassicaformis CCMP3155]|eukprot:CEL98305.1 unnamed protein product [Vitrella brassicaformis CCMP3155]
MSLSEGGSDAVAGHMLVVQPPYQRPKAWLAIRECGKYTYFDSLTDVPNDLTNVAMWRPEKIYEGDFEQFGIMAVGAELDREDTASLLAAVRDAVDDLPHVIVDTERKVAASAQASREEGRVIFAPWSGLGIRDRLPAIGDQACGAIM